MVEATRSQSIVLVGEPTKSPPTLAEAFEAMVITDMAKEKRTKFLIELPFRDMMEPRLGPSTFRKASAPFAQFAKEPSKKQRNKKHF